MGGRWRAAKNWALNVGCWMLAVFSRRPRKIILLTPLLLAPGLLPAQTPPSVPAGSLMQLQVAQPMVDVTTPVTAEASFDPPVVRPGEKTFYRVTVDATESSIQWPDNFYVPLVIELGPGVRGQIVQNLPGKFRPLTTFVYEARATAAGHFTVPAFNVAAYGKLVTVPAASLDAVAENSISNPPARRIVLETSATNLFLGQPFHVRVLLPASPPNSVEALREVQLNGDGFMTDKTQLRQAVEMVDRDGQKFPAFVMEMTVTPIAAGELSLSAQGFTAGREFSGPISITGQVIIPGGPPKYVLLVSEPVALRVQPLPAEGRLPGFTGAIGKFTHDPPQLSTNRVGVGEAVHVKMAVHGEGNLNRLVPPAPPQVKDWQIIPDPSPDFSFTLIPLTDEATATPAIPFSCFDPASASYVDLTIPPLPIAVVAEGMPVALPAMDESRAAGVPAKLSGLAPAPGKSASSLKPLQLRGWFVGVQLAPAAGFLALWQWDRRRRFFELHPDILRRRQAKRELRREKRRLQKAAAGGDAEKFLRHAVTALRVASAPHYPAQPQALVCADVLAQLEAAALNGRHAEIVRQIFAAADAQFAAKPQTRGDLLALRSGVTDVLVKLEERL